MSETSSSSTPLLDEWRVEVGDDAIASAVQAARAQIAEGPEELFAWVPDGPPRTSGLVVAGVQLYEDP